MKKEIADFFNKHKGVRRLALLWAILVSTFAIFNPERFTDAKFAVVIGLVSIVIAFYTHKGS